MRTKIIILFTSYFIILFLITSPTIFGSGSQNHSTKEERTDMYTPYDSRSNSSKETKLVFDFSDEENDVIITDDRLEPYSESQGYDIKNISSEISGGNLWLNMSIYDLILDNTDVYYKMTAADSEVILFRGDGYISYADKTNDFSVSYSKSTISALIDLNKVTYTTFEISGRAYRQDEMEPYGDFVISDEISGNTTGLEQFIMDSKDDVQIAYTESKTIKGSPEIDIIESQLKDFGDELTVTVSMRGQVEKAKDISYSIELGEAEFTYSNGEGVMKYKDDARIPVNVEVTGSSLSTSFDKDKLTYSSLQYFISTKYQPVSNKTYQDGHSGRLPFYLYSYGEKMDLEVSMFESENIVIKMFGELSELYTVRLRSVIDELGNDNGNVEQTEVEYFISLMDGNFTTTDFFELRPYVDSVPGQSQIMFNFENATGNINSQKTVKIEIKGSWKYVIPDKDHFNITIRLPLEHIDAPYVSNFVFNFVYDNIMFKFTSENKYWEFDPVTSPTYISEYLELDKNTITIPDLEYYALNNRLPEPEFSFNIKYNQTLADLDKPKPKNGDDNGSPGFEVIIILIAVFACISYYVSSKAFHRK